MKRITFLIGNGFDINVGLNTGYSEFCKYYLNKYSDDMLAKEIKKDYELWSDLEIGLGEYTEKVSELNEEEFFESKDVMENALADYLEDQMERIRLTEENVNDVVMELKDSILNFYKDFPSSQYEDIRKVISSVATGIEYSFITFNYTDTLDRCLQLTKEHLTKNIGQHQSGSSVYTDTIGEVLHIHGTTKEELILAVNDESQVKNEKLCTKELNRQCMIKAEANERFGQNKISAAKNIIDNSVIICIFGMSIGATDKMWWEYICKWLAKDDDHRLVIFSRNEDTKGRITNRQLFMMQDKIFNKLWINTDISEDEWKEIRKKVYVIFDSSIFNIKLTET